MSSAAGDAQSLARLVAPATAEQLIRLHNWFEEVTDDLARTPEFVAHAEPGVADALARWVVTQGRKAWSDAGRDATGLPTQPPAGALDVPGLLARLYRERFGGDMPDDEPEPPADLQPQPEDEDELWELVDFAKTGIPLQDMLASRTRSELVRFARAHRRVFDRLNARALETLGDDPIGTGWAAWTDWVIGLGKATYDRYLADPQSAPREIPKEVDWFLDKLRDVYFDRYGEPMP